MTREKLETMVRCGAVYQTGTYGAMGGAMANALPLPNCLEMNRIIATVNL